MATTKALLFAVSILTNLCEVAATNSTNDSSVLTSRKKFILSENLIESIPRIHKPLNPYGLEFHQTRYYGACISRESYNRNFSTIQPWAFNFDYIVTGCGVDWYAPGPPYKGPGSMYPTCVFSWVNLKDETRGVYADDTRPFSLERRDDVVVISVHPDPRHQRYFFDTIMPHFEKRSAELSVYLHTGGVDNWTGMGTAKFVNNSRAIKRWVVEQTTDAGDVITRDDYPKVKLLPTGVCQKDFDGDNGEVMMQAIHDAQPWAMRKSGRVLFCFKQHMNDMRAVWYAWGRANCKICDFCRTADGVVSHAELWKLYGEYRFIVSPLGAGPDCGRSWEILLLGAVPLIAQFPGAKAYTRPPFSLKSAIVLRNVTDITPENMTLWENMRMRYNGTDRSLLTHEFWSRLMFESKDV